MRLLPIALALFVAGPASAADVPLPEMNGKVGDFIVFKSSRTVAGNTSDTTMRVTLTELTKTFAAVKAKMSIKGIDPANLPDIPIPGIPANVGLDPAGLPDNAYSKLEEKPTDVTSGKETLTVGGQKLECVWVQMTVKRGGGDMTFNVITKYWVSKQVPVTGLVKAQVSQKIPGLGDVKATYELTEFGPK